MIVEKPIDSLTPADVEGMNYSNLIGVMRETVRPPGAFQTVQRLAELTFLSPRSRVLEVGTGTGFTAHELAWLVGCHVDAIDIEQNSLDEAKRRAKELRLDGLTNFQRDDVMALSFSDDSFDLLFCGNMTCLVPDPSKAVSEYERVLKNGGVLAATPMYYVDEIPPESLLQAVSVAQSTTFRPNHRKEAMSLFNRRPFELLYTEDYRFDHLEDSVIDEFVNALMARPHLDPLQPDTRAALGEKYRRYMGLFGENLKYMGYTLAIWRKEPNPVDPHLFTGHRLS